MKDNVCGSFSTSDNRYLKKVNEALYADADGKIYKAVDYLEAEFTGVYYRTPGRPFALDADDAYPEEIDDERQLTKVTLYHTDDTISETTDSGELEELQEILDDLLYDAELESIGGDHDSYWD
jgi:hypothetical protein